MSTLPYITFVAGPVDVGLVIVVGGTVLLALARRRP
jgi:hypothetical protein